MRNVFIIGVGMTRFAKHLERSVKSLGQEALKNALADANITVNKLESIYFSNSMWGHYSDQHCIRGQVVMRDMGIGGIPTTNVENACGGGSTALHLAWQSVASGHNECALALGAEKTYNENRDKMFKSFSTGIDVEKTEAHFSAWRNVLDGLQLDIPADQDDAKGAGKNRSAFMDVYAGMCRWHMATYNTTKRHLAIISSKNHFHSTMNPNAQFQKEMSVEEILAGRPVIWPLTVPMCAPIGDGGAAVIVCSGEFLKNLKSPRPVKILASVLGAGTDRKIWEEDKDIAVRISRKAYEIAGVGPEDIDVAEVHDATAYGELHQTEALGFCKPGEGGAFAESGATRLGGKIPVNTSGGLISRGHPLGASGLGQIHEMVTQLRHGAGKRQVENCRIALAENGGGNIGFEEAAMGLHLLERVE